MAKKKQSDNQIKQLPEYGELISIMQSETASILTDYIRQYIGTASIAQPGQGIFMNFDRVLMFESWKEKAWYDLYAEVEKDPHIQAILGSAKTNVAGMAYSINPFIAGDGKKPTSRDEKIADFVRDALKGVGYLPQHLYNLMGALGMGFAVSEIVWDATDDGIKIKSILNRPQRRFQFDAMDRSLKLRNLEQPYMGRSLPDKKFIVHRCSNQWENPFGDALDQSLYWMWLFKKTVLKFWMQHLQVGASSIPVVKHPVNANAQLKAEALEIAKMIHQGAYGRLPVNFEIIWAEAKNAIQNADAYYNFVRMCNDEMSKCVNGQSLTTEASSEGGKGTQALGTVHAGVQSARDIFRASGLASTINSTLIPWIVDFNFANVDGYPEFRFDLEEPDDLVKESTIIKNLSDAGYEADENELSEKFNYTLKKKEVKPILAAPKVDENGRPIEPTSDTSIDEKGNLIDDTTDKGV